jgi:hypothetical protein
MKKILLILAFVFPIQAVSGSVDQYVDEGDGFILLTVRCAAEGIHPCNCAILSEDLVAEDEDPFMCWNISGDKIIFENARRRIEKRLDEIKSRINTPSPSTFPPPENPTPSGRPSDSLA